LYSQVRVSIGELDLLPFEEEVKVYRLLQPVEDHNLSFTKVAIKCKRSQKRARVSSCLCNPTGDEARRTTSSAKSKMDWNLVEDTPITILDILMEKGL
jgi:hypothetical protein